MADFWRDLVLTAMRNMSVTLGTVLPSILAMLTLVVLGAVLGWIAWALVGRLARAMDLDQRSRTWGVTSALARAGVYRPPSQVLRLVAFWGIFVIFATMGIDALAIPGAPGATGVLLRVLPRLLSALLILVVGWLAANFLGQAMLIAAVNAGVVQARLLARATRWSRPGGGAPRGRRRASPRPAAPARGSPAPPACLAPHRPDSPPSPSIVAGGWDGVARPRGLRSLLRCGWAPSGRSCVRRRL